MVATFDSVLLSNDLSLDRVLNVGMPVVLIFHDKSMAADLRSTLNDLARQYAGKALIVMLSQEDAQQAMSQFDVHQLPAIVTMRDGKTVARQESIRAAEIKPYVAHLIGEGPIPSPRVAERPAVEPRQTSGAGPLSVNEADFEREVLHSGRPVMVDFWAPWCGPCRMVVPTLEKLAREQSKLKIVKVNVDENPGLASRYGTMSIPTMIVFNGGHEVDRWVGALPESALRTRAARWIGP
jgi:thioredoxin